MSRLLHLDEHTLLDQSIVPWRQQGQFVYTWPALDLTGAVIDATGAWARLVIYDDRGDTFPILDFENDQAGGSGASQISFPAPLVNGLVRFTAGVTDAPKARRGRWYQMWVLPSGAPERIIIGEGDIDVLHGGAPTPAGDPNL